MKTAEEIIEFINKEIVDNVENRNFYKNDPALKKASKKKIDDLYRVETRVYKKIRNFILEKENENS